MGAAVLCKGVGGHAIITLGGSGACVDAMGIEEEA